MSARKSAPQGARLSLFAHALRLHQRHPDEPLPRDGEPFPDEAAHQGGLPGSRGPRRDGAEVAEILDRYFGDPSASPADLADAFHGVHVPIHRNDHIAAAALRAKRKRVRRIGRRLVRHSTDRCSATVGLALLATDWHEDDVPLIRTIGLLSNRFGPLAAEALSRRPGGVAALLWLAQRTSGWGRVYVIEALCRSGPYEARDWLLRNACDGDFLNGYFAGKVATTAHLHEAITRDDVDDELVDHTGRLLRIMTECGGMGMTLHHYPPADQVLSAHAAHLARRPPTFYRYVNAAVTGTDHYLELLRRPDWVAAARAGFADDPDYLKWFADTVAVRLGLPDFSA
ncbi:hypothetical protein FHR83_008565 [Actinoplanes campanulatus]|uniref:Uncharacterized protein n=1 Tax=Actinoplanes campanulatus TaxID=113559 RepID=A0A7W5FJK2_9ACTN|nr:hypothetical protein [Actinoplanes campanulatus]MBB3100839.1 hypothetical protein [Actinoplanes campanulatus]GGN46362.1 hypothetical protein GCM10010109_81440 [Actinoplanes campanulatus]GID41249.1 hypothetical protein Aca09nite_77550 [Actinoplanes campanulatus]